MIKILVILLFVIAADSDYVVPEPTFEVLKSGDWRVYIPADPSTILFAINANLNSNIEAPTPGTISEDTITKTDNFWVINSNYALKVGDVLHYWIHVNTNAVGLKRSGSWTVSELKESFRALSITPRAQASSRKNGETTSLGELIFEDLFEGPKIDTTKWIVEHKIPTYSGPNFEFNSYENHDDTRFFKDGKLFLKPIALEREHQVRGALNFTKDCTSSRPEECYYKQVSSFLLPPVQSAKITSKVSFKYGKVSIRAKLPSGDWIYPIIELEQKERTDGENSAKIWIAYSRGNDYLIGGDSHDLGSRLLFAGPMVTCSEPERSQYLRSYREKDSFSNDFREYTLEWTPDKMVFYVDSMEYGKVDLTQIVADPPIDVRITHSPVALNPFDREYVVSLGVAVGGMSDFPDGYHSENDPKPWLNGERNYIKKFFDARNVWKTTWKGDNAALQIDYVKVWAV